MTQIRFGFPARRNSSGGGQREVFVFLWMHEWVCSAGWRHSQDIFQLLPPSHARRNATGAKQTRGNLSSPRLTSDNRPLPSLISHFPTDGTRMSSAYSAIITYRQVLCVFVFFISQSKQQLALVWVCFCSPFKGGQPAYKLSSHLLPQPLSGEFICIQITNNQTSEGSFG